MTQAWSTLVTRSLAVDLVPPPGDSGDLRYLAYVDFFVGAHRLASFLDRDLYAMTFVDLDENHSRRVAAVIHRGACPI